MNQPRQTWELEAAIQGRIFVYRLVIQPWGDPVKPRVVEESVRCDGSLLFEFIEGEVHLFNDKFEHKVTFPLDWHRSALATVQARPDNLILTSFRQAVPQLLCFRLNPFAMDARAEGEDDAPNPALGNFAAWYRHLLQVYPRQNSDFLLALKGAMIGFEVFKLNPYGENTRVLVAEFAGADPGRSFGLGQLSDGQRCLIGLYAILHFVLALGCTVVIDEPDNFISLREIQPWLSAAEEILDQGQGQLIIISHHPEFLNPWAPDHGIYFFREDSGPVRSQPFAGMTNRLLTSAELIARGWERE
jgi:hypothetical protein